MPSVSRFGPISVTLPILISGLPGSSYARHADTNVSLESGDRVRVWSPQADLSGDEFDFRQWRSDSLVLLRPQRAALTKLSRPQIERLKVHRKSGGTNFWEGVLIGGGAGLAANVITVSAVGCDVLPLACGIVVALRTLVRGLVLGELVGAGFPEYEWVSVEVGPTGTTGSSSDAGPFGAGIRVRIGTPD